MMRAYSWFRQRKLATGWLLMVGLAALTAPTTALQPDLAHTNAPPFQPAHWLGTTPQGLDVGMHLWQGARMVLMVSLPATVCTLLLGALLGGAAGFWGNTRLRVTQQPILAALLLLMLASLVIPHVPLLLALLLLLIAGGGIWAGLTRTGWGSRKRALPLDSYILGGISLLNSVPLLVLVVAVAAVQPPSISGVVALLSLTCWTTPARLMRAATLQSSSQPYVEAALAAGIPPARVVWRHVGPNALPVLIVRLPLTVSALIGLETTLSFLGVGLPPEAASWGRLLASVRQAPTDWWLLVWPGLCLVFTVLSLQQFAGRTHDGQMSQQP